MKIYSIHYNKPEYIYLQKKSIDKYFKVPYEFIIMDNSIDFSIKKDIKNITDELGIGYIDCNNHRISMDSMSHQNALSIVVDNIKNGEDIMILDHDLFLISDVTEDYYSECDLFYYAQIKYDENRDDLAHSVEYTWPGLIIFNNIKNKDMSFKSGLVENCKCDTGGYMYYYIKNNNLKVKKILHHEYVTSDKLLMEKFDNRFIHLISGSGWNSNYDLFGKLNYIKEKYDI